MERSGWVTGAAAVGVVVLTAGVGLASADVVGGGISPMATARMTHDSSAMHRTTVTSEGHYLAQMVPHHEEAVTAAKHLARSDRPELRRLGRDIVRVQTAEIATMRRWLTRWYPAQPASTSASMMRDLSGLEGDTLDQAFLDDMVPHHMMAVMMSHQLLARDLVDHPQVAAFARGVATSQHAEIVQMRQWLAEWFGVRSGPGTGMQPGTGMGPGMRMGPGSGMRMGPGMVPSVWTDDGASAAEPAGAAEAAAPAALAASRQVRVDVQAVDLVAAPKAAASVRQQAQVQQVHRTHRQSVRTGSQHRHGQRVVVQPGRHR